MSNLSLLGWREKPEVQAPALPNLLCDPVQVLPSAGLALSSAKCRCCFLTPEAPSPPPLLSPTWASTIVSPAAGALRMKVFLEIFSQQVAGSHQFGPALLDNGAGL